MAANLYLDDGREFLCSNRAISNSYFLMARQARDPRLRLWLFDLSGQCAPFFDIDTRGLSPENRKEFWVAAQRALEEVTSRLGEGSEALSSSDAADCLQRLLIEKGKIERGELADPEEVREDVMPTDVEGDRWLTDEEAEAEFRQQEIDFLQFVGEQRLKKSG